MGKNNLLLGTARGKLGDVVFYRTGGEQRFRTRVRPTNPRTNAQLLQRTVVSTAVKFYSEVVTICNHAFQNYEGSLKNHQRFMKLNIDMLRKIALNNVESWSPIQFSNTNYGNFVEKDSSKILINPYQLSEGDLPTIPVTIDNGRAYLGTEMQGGHSYGEVAKNLGINMGDQITMVWIQCKQNSAEIEQTLIGRVIMQPSVGDSGTTMFSGTGINQPNKENTGQITIGYTKTSSTGEGTEEKYKIYIAIPNLVVRAGGPQAAAAIVSRFENGKWRRSTSFLTIVQDYSNLSGLREAMESYMKSNTSSLYLNQSVDGIEESLENKTLIETYENEEKTYTRRERKNNKDAE